MHAWYKKYAMVISWQGARSAEHIQYEGARNALWYIVSSLKDNLLTVVPSCVDHFLTPLQRAQSGVEAQSLVNALQVRQHYIFTMHSCLI